MKFIASILLLLSLANAANDKDFDNLKSALRKFYMEEPSEIPDVVRLSYHDLLNQPKAAGLGCIQKRSFQNARGNQLLDHTVQELEKIIKGKEFRNANFDFGDVIAFAGKIAVEMAYPCYQIKFKYGRGKCPYEQPVITSLSGAPSPNMLHLSEMNPNHEYVNMSRLEFTILTVGAHSIKDAHIHKSTNGFHGDFSRKSSGADYIKTTLDNVWMATKVKDVVVFVSKTLARLQSDLLFFHDAQRQYKTLFKRKGGKSSTKCPDDKFCASDVPTSPQVAAPSPKIPEEIAEEKELQGQLLNLDNFDAEFVRIYEKMLDVGGGNQLYVERIPQIGCAAPDTVTPPANNVVTPPVNNSVTPPANNSVTPPANDVVTPPVNNSVTPPANDVVTPPANNVMTPPANNANKAFALFTKNDKAFALFPQNINVKDVQVMADFLLSFFRYFK